jgi:hypothetical protein
MSPGSPTTLFDQDMASISEPEPAPGTEPGPEPGAPPADPPPLAERARELLGLEHVHLRGFFDDRPLLNPEIDRGSLKRDGKVFFGALVAGLLLLGGLTWVGLRLIADAQRSSPTATKAASATGGSHAVDHRSIRLSSSALPAGPQVGQAVVLPILTDNTANVQATVLYEDDKAVTRVPGLETAISWTPKAEGERTLKVVFELASGAVATSPDVKVEVVAAHAGTSDVPAPIVGAAQKLVDAVNAKDWDAVRRIDPTKAQWSDDRLSRSYAGLERDTLVPVGSSTTAGRNGATRLYAGLYAEQDGGNRLYCVVWDVNPATQQVAQVNGRQLFGAAGQASSLDDAQQQLVSACRAG